MRKLIIAVTFSLILTVLAAAPAFAYHDLGPCNESGEPGLSDFAEHHVVPLAHAGDLGKEDHDGDGITHVVGNHQGVSERALKDLDTCNN